MENLSTIYCLYAYKLISEWCIIKFRNHKNQQRELKEMNLLFGRVFRALGTKPLYNPTKPSRSMIPDLHLKNKREINLKDQTKSYLQVVKHEACNGRGNINV